MKRIWSLIWVIGLIAVLLSCCWSFHFWYRNQLTPDNPPESFREMDLVGVWKADYRRYEWEVCGDNAVMRQARSLMEWLVLREDKTFYQVLQDRRGQIPDQCAQGTWWVERFPDGVTWLHLEKGRFFAGEVCKFFPNLAPITSTWGWGSIQAGHDLVLNLQEEVVMIVGWDKFTRELYLEYPYVNVESPTIVEFEQIPDSKAITIPIPGP